MSQALDSKRQVGGLKTSVGHLNRVMTVYRVILGSPITSSHFKRLKAREKESAVKRAIQAPKDTQTMHREDEEERDERAVGQWHLERLRIQWKSSPGKLVWGAKHNQAQ